MKLSSFLVTTLSYMLIIAPGCKTTSQSSQSLDVESQGISIAGDLGHEMKEEAKKRGESEKLEKALTHFDEVKENFNVYVSSGPERKLQKLNASQVSALKTFAVLQSGKTAIDRIYLQSKDSSNFKVIGMEGHFDPAKKKATVLLTRMELDRGVERDLSIYTSRQLIRYVKDSSPMNFADNSRSNEEAKWENISNMQGVKNFFKSFDQSQNAGFGLQESGGAFKASMWTSLLVIAAGCVALSCFVPYYYGHSNWHALITTMVAAGTVVLGLVIVNSFALLIDVAT